MLSSGNILPTQEAILPALIKENQQLLFAGDDDGNQTKELKYRLASLQAGPGLAGLVEAWEPHEFIGNIVSWVAPEGCDINSSQDKAGS